MRQTTIATFCIQLVNRLHKVQSSSKHYSMFKQHSNPDDQKTRASLLNEATGCWSLDPIRLLYSTPTHIPKKGVQTPKLPLNGRSDSFIKPRMGALSDSKAFWLIRILCVTSSALCHLCCFVFESRTGVSRAHFSWVSIQIVTHLWWGRDGWACSKCHPKIHSHSTGWVTKILWSLLHVHS